MSHEPNETLRKSLHIAVGAGALTLRWLPWWAAAGVAAAAVLGNWLVLHRIVGRTVSRHERGWDAGIVLYPLAVLILIVIFRDDLHVAAVAWAVLGFGDGFATLIGRGLGGPRLPWNRDKTWAGFLGFIGAGFLPVYLVSWFVSDEPALLPRGVIVLAALVAGAIAESLPLGVDDNITVPAAAAVTVWLVSFSAEPRFFFGPGVGAFLVLNTLLAVLGYALRSVTLSGMIGGWLLGVVLIVFGFPTLYFVLLAFFVLGTITTKIGYRRKADLGIAQESGGRRGFGHAFANVGVAAICAIALSLTGATEFWWAAVAALATATADTVASEVGQLIGRRTFMPLTFRSVPRGTEGAISLEGTAAGIAAAALVSFIGFLAIMTPGEEAWTLFQVDLTDPGLWLAALTPVVVCATCAFIGSYVESLAGTWNRTRNLGIANGALNFFNTAVGAALALAIVPFLIDLGMMI